MKKYKKCSNVELLEICGEYLLVSTKEARDKCPYVTQINQSAAEYWNLWDRAYVVNDFVEHVAEISGKEKKQVLLPILLFVDKLSKNGYLIPENAE